MKMKSRFLFLLLLAACDKGVNPIDPIPARVIYLKEFNVHLADVFGNKYESFTRWGSPGTFSPNQLKFVYYKSGLVDSVRLMLVDALTFEENYLSTIMMGTGSYWTDAQWSRGGNYVVYSAPKGEHKDDIYLFDLYSMQERRLTSVGTNFRPRISPSGVWISCMSRSPGDSLFRIRIVNTIDTSSFIIDPGAIPLSSFWLSDERIIAEIRPYGSLQIVDIVMLNTDGTGHTYLSQDHKSRVIDVLDPNSIAVVRITESSGNFIEVLNVDSKERQPIGIVSEVILTKPVLSPDFKYLGYTTIIDTARCALHVSPFATWQPVKIDESSSAVVHSISIAP